MRKRCRNCKHAGPPRYSANHLDVDDMVWVFCRETVVEDDDGNIVEMGYDVSGYFDCDMFEPEES